MENNKISQEEAILILLTGMSFVDKVLHKDEEKLLKDYCSKEKISPSFLKETLSKFKIEKDTEKLTLECLDLISSTSKQYKAIKEMEALSNCDNVLHPSELNLLSEIRKKWGIKISNIPEVELDKHQKEIAESSAEERIVVNAPPGTGKTEVLCARIGYLLNQGVNPKDIWAMSFTRSAVKEMRNRIEYFSEKEGKSFGVNLSTIDSRAFNLRYGLSLEDTQKLFGDYDTAIEEAIKILKDENEHAKMLFRNYKHFIIDEAQDLVGERALFVIRIFELLPEKCGITIFLDPRQAIYNFSEKKRDENEKSLKF